MRHRFIRTLFGEIFKATRIEKIVLLLPFLVLIFDAEIFYFALLHKEKNIMIASAFVLFLSVLEIIAVFGEIHERISGIRRKEILMEKLRQIAENMKKPTVRKIMDTFMEKYGEEYSVNEVYHATCDLLSEFGNK